MRSHRLKRCLAMLLTFAMIVTAIPTQAFANNVTSTEENIQTTSDVKTYTITFYADENMTVELQKVTVEEGKIPEWTPPVKESDEYYRYEFIGWDEEVTAAYADKNYYAKWKEIEQFSILFLDWDGSEVLDKPLRVDKGTDLTKCEGVPMDLDRAADADYTYEFIGWTPELSTSVEGELTYTAQYKATEIINYVDMTFDVAENGTYTVNGEAITQATEIKDTTTKTDYVLKATAAEGYEFFGWYDGVTYLSGDAEYKFRPTEDMTIKPKFVKENTPKFMVDGIMYEGFDRATTAAEKNDSDGVMVLMNNATLEEGSYCIPEDVTLLIPCDEEATVYRDKPVVSSDEAWIAPKAYRTLTLGKNAELVVEGELSLASPHIPGAGSKENGGSPHKSYGQIATESGSSITVEEDAFLYAYGYITGQGHVTAEEDATVYEYFQIMDFKGGSATTAMASTGAKYGVFPLSQYYVQNIEVPLTIEAGANEYCYTSLKMSGNIVSSAVGFIGDGEEMMFKLKSGSVTKQYDGDKDRLIAEINGDLDISPIVMSGGGNTIDSDDFVLPINSNITIKANSGTINMTQDVALVPGSELIIGKSATCVLGENSNVYVYDQNTWGKYCSSNKETFVDLNYAPGKTYTRTDADLVDALVQVEGVLDASKGYLYTTEGGANIFSTDGGKIVLRVGTTTHTYQYEYMGPDYDKATYYGKYYEIPVDAALLKNADGTFVNQDKYEENNIINYTYTNGVWEPIGHPYNEFEEEPASCLFEGRTYGTSCAYGEACAEHHNPSEIIPALGHSFTVVIPEKAPTYTSVGWNEHHACDRCNAKGDDYVEVEKLKGAAILTYDEFIENLEILEQWANDYVKENPGKDPLALVIKYIRTGVDRYNSGSWNIMAGYEDTGFATYVANREDKLNAEAAANGKPLLKVSGMKNIENFKLDNGDKVDFGHMFGTMDITYHNNFSVNHADVAGWAGDIVDLLSLADQFGTGDAKNVNEMADYIYKHYLFKETSEIEKEFGEELKEGSFSLVDMIGDLDGYYITSVLSQTEYENGTLTEIVEEYFEEDLTEATRAKYFLENRFDDISLRVDLRNEVYREVTDNSVINTLEATREFESEDLTTLRKACCYAFADYICQQAGDYVDTLENSLYSVFSSSFSTLAPGINMKVYKAKTADGLQTDFYTATIDVTRDDVQVYANYNDNDPSKGWQMQRVIDQANAAQNKYGNPESDKYIENYNVIASINGGGYNMSTGEPGGLLIMNGQEYHPVDGGGFFAILDDGSAMIGSLKDYNNGYKDRIKEAIGGFGTMLVKNGKVSITATSDYFTDRAGRTAVGITKTGKVVFMVMDGRQGEYTCGGSMAEIAQVMLDAGCETAINLDGGGSSTFVAREEGADSLSVVNKPSDGVSRSVSTSLFAVSTAPSSTTFDHAVLTSDYGYLTVGSSVQLTAAGVSATNNKVDLPEGTQWAVSDESMGTINEKGVFTAKANGDVEIRLMLEGEVVGETTLHVVTPDNLYFKKTSANAVYGQTIDIPVNAVYNNKNVAINGNDILFKLSDEKAGSCEGLKFTAAANSQLKTVKITAGLPNNDQVAAIFTVYLYDQGEASFDFDQALGGDEQFAWNRTVSNAITEDTLVYSAIDRDKDMTTSYTFAIDMSKLDIPEKLEGLIYMLPGADMEGASAWSFLCQLAERMSDMTEVKATIKLDEDVDVDISDVTLVNDYFQLTGKEYDKATNTLTLRLNWIKQDKPIEVEQANPVCILSGIKITPKKGASWNTKDQLSIVNTGEVSYSVYMRASGLYTFSQNPTNQEIYGLTPFVNPNKETERGGKFTSVYEQFTDSYTLDKSIKNGWVGSRYFENGKMYTGICYVAEEGLYYDFGKDGKNTEGPYTGDLIEKGKEYYVVNGEIFKKGSSIWNDEKDDGWIRFGLNDWRYYEPKTGERKKVTIEKVERTCVIDTKYTLTTETGIQRVVWDDNAGGHEYVTEGEKAICSVCGWERLKMKDVKITFDHKNMVYTGTPRENGVTCVNPQTGDTLIADGEFKDYTLTYKDNVEVGTAKCTIKATKTGRWVNINEWRGNYRGYVIKSYKILPDAPKNANGVYNDGKVELTWKKAKVEETDTAQNNTKYVIYKSVNGGAWKKVDTTTKTSYTITKGMKNDDEIKLRIKTMKVGNDGKTYESAGYANVTMTYKTPKVVLSNDAATGKVKLKWAKVSGVKKYEVYRTTAKNGKYTKMVTTSNNYFINKNATLGKTYFYKVKAVKFGSKIKESNIASGKSVLARPNVTASNVAASGKIKLTWKKVEGAKKYTVYRATSKNGKYFKMATTTKRSYVNTSAKAGKVYYYKVKAIAGKVSLNSEFSLVDSRTCDLKSPVVTAKSNVKKQVKLTWKKVDGAKKYEIYRTAFKNGKFTKIATTTKTTYTNKALKSGKTYYYKVKAVASNSAANSALSAKKGVKVK